MEKVKKYLKIPRRNRKKTLLRPLLKVLKTGAKEHMDISSHGHLESRQLIEQGVVDFEIDNF
jgi:hypothetical protein